MIIGSHILLYTENPEADRAFFRDVLEFPFVDVGHGWLIFKLPVAEAALHPSDENTRPVLHAGHRQLGAVLYFMCDDLRAQVKLLES
jgi:catechol 2,3-dioxygenase-like lactoylglutathione lyase family enzyme